MVLRFGNTTLYGYQYEVSKIVLNFHNLTRYGPDWKQSNATILEDEEYSQDMFMFMLMGGIVIIGLFIILIVNCCFGCLIGCLRRKPKKIQKCKCCSVSTILTVSVVIVTLATFSLGFIGTANWRPEVCDRFRSFVKIFSDVHEDSVGLVDKVPPILDQISEELAAAKAEAVGTQLEANIAEWIEQYNPRKDEIKPILNKLKEEVNPWLDKTVKPVEKLAEQCQDERLKTINYILLAVWAFITTIFILGLFNGCLRGFSCGIGFIFFGIFSITALFLFLSLVWFSDACVDFKQYLLKHGGSDAPDLYYYLYCSKFNPSDQRAVDLETFLEDTKKTIRMAQETLNKIDKELDQNIQDHCQNPEDDLKRICELLPQLKTTVGSLYPYTTEVLSLVQKLECKSITPMINGFLSYACTNTFEAVFLIWANYTLTTVGYFLLAMITSYCLLI